MQPVPSTAQVLACKALNRLTEKVWLDWSYEMLTIDFMEEMNDAIYYKFWSRLDQSVYNGHILKYAIIIISCQRSI